jgi:hypothetical protein
VTSEPVVRTVAAAPIAAVRRRLRPGEIGGAWKPALDLVWAVVRSEPGLWAGGHNVFVYHPADNDGRLMVEFGVEVTRPCSAQDEVVPAESPGGRIVEIVRTGPIERLPEAYAAIDDWMAAHGELAAGATWEIYGDWGPDPATHQVTLRRLLG